MANNTWRKFVPFFFRSATSSAHGETTLQPKESKDALRVDQRVRLIGCMPHRVCPFVHSVPPHFITFMSSLAPFPPFSSL